MTIDRSTTKRRVHRGFVTLLGVVALAAVFVPAGPSRADDHAWSGFVDTSDPDGVTTDIVLDAFATYDITVDGAYEWQRNGFADVADAECSTHDSAGVTQLGADYRGSQPGWQPHRFAFIGTEFMHERPLMPVETEFWDPDPTDDPLDLYVDGRAYEWIPGGFPIPFTNEDGYFRPVAPGCSASHEYRLLYSPVADRPATFHVHDLHNADNQFPLRVELRKAADSPFVEPPPGEYLETVVVRARDADGTVSKAHLSGERTYLVLAHGVYSYISHDNYFYEGNLADAACYRAPVPVEERLTGRYPQWQRNPDGPWANALELLIEDEPVPWQPVAPTDTSGMCDGASHYYATLVADHEGPVGLRIHDFDLPGPAVGYEDNTGSLSVEIIELPDDLLADPGAEVCLTLNGDTLVCTPSEL